MLTRTEIAHHTPLFSSAAWVARSRAIQARLARKRRQIEAPQPSGLVVRETTGWIQPALTPEPAKRKNWWQRLLAFFKL